MLVKIKNYKDSNELFVNSDKTHILVLASSKHGDFGIKLSTGSEIIEPSLVERLIGANVTNNYSHY